MTGTIEVTQQDIDTFNEAFESRQLRCVPEQCPIALAAKRSFPNQEIWVGFRYIRINGTKYLSSTPGILQDFAKLLFYPVKFNIVEAPKPAFWSYYGGLG